MIFETYRRQSDKEPIRASEETYPSEECVEVTFRVLKANLEKAAGKSNRSFSSFLSF